MKLWTIQTEKAWRSLNKRGYLRCRRSDANRDFLPAYEWMISQMSAHIGRPANGISVPLWAWYQYNTEKHRRPDLRRSAHLARGTRGYRIEFTIPPDQVLLSDFDLWHYVLNYWYLPLSEDDDDAFSARNGLLHCSWSNPPRNKHVDTEIRSSWHKIFNLDWSDEYVAHAKADKSIQATFWQLDLPWITNVDEFIAR